GERPGNELPGNDRGDGGQRLLVEPGRQDPFSDSLLSNTQGAEDQGRRRPLPQDRARQVCRWLAGTKPAEPNSPTRPLTRGAFVVGGRNGPPPPTGGHRRKRRRTSGQLPNAGSTANHPQLSEKIPNRPLLP